MKPLSSISSIDLRDFLKAQGWTQRQEGLADRLYVLQNPRFPRRQLVFPMDTTAPDYAESIQRVIEKFSEMMSERPQSLLSQIQTLRDDTLRFRVFTEQGGGDGSLPLSFTSIGTVERLCGDMGEEGQRAGEVILALLLPEGESVRARVALSAKDYIKADQAHMTEGAYVQVAGKLQQGRQPRAMTELSQFELILPQPVVE